MSDKGRSFRSERARKLMHQIEDELKASPLSTIEEIADKVSTSKSNVGDYLRYLASIGRAHCAVRAKMIHNAGIPAQWSAGKSPLDLTDYDAIDEVDTSPRKVIVRKEWATTKIHDPYALPAEFFGKAA